MSDTPAVVKEKIESFAKEIIDKNDERMSHGNDVTTMATGRMTVMRIGGMEYEITCTLKARGGNPAK